MQLTSLQLQQIQMQAQRQAQRQAQAQMQGVQRQARKKPRFNPIRIMNPWFDPIVEHDGPSLDTT
jgi:hypothetical protein